MKKNRWLRIALLLIVLLIPSACEAPYADPPATFRDSDLVGTWETYYGRSLDRLILKADGTFKQVYRDVYRKGYTYETSWNKWWVERFPDGRARVHLKKARYYLDGIATAERDGRHAPEPYEGFWGATGPLPFDFYDPFSQDVVQMVGELVLNVRSDSSGKLILHHMWTSSDGGFALFGGETELFRRVEPP